MTFPKRWLDDDTAGAPMKDLLRSGQDMDPPDGAQNAVWIALAAKIGTAGVATAAATTTAKTAATASATTATSATTTAVTTAGTTATTTAAVSGGLFKAIVIGALSGVVAITGYSALEPSISPPPPQSTAATQGVPAPQKDTTPARGAAAPSNDPVTAQPSPQKPATSPSSDSPSLPVGASAPAPSALNTASPTSPQDNTPPSTDSPAPGSAEDRERQLREEREVVNQARTALRGGDTGGAMRLLEQARVKFPNGALGQEREALAIETLAKSGAKEAASTRAAAFIKAHPTSPHAARLQVFVLP